MAGARAAASRVAPAPSGGGELTRPEEEGRGTGGFEGGPAGGMIDGSGRAASETDISPAGGEADREAACGGGAGPGAAEGAFSVEGSAASEPPQAMQVLEHGSL